MMKFYNLPPGVNPRRVRIFCAEKGIALPTVDLDMTKNEHQTPEFLARNPFAKLPVLELDDGTCLSESIAICRYLEELNPEPPLFGRDARERAIVEMWNRRAELEVMRYAIDVFVHTSEFWKGRRPQVAAYGEVARGLATEGLRLFDRHLADREFVAADHYTVADITLQCAVLVGRNTGTPIPEDCTALGAWWDRVKQRPSARA